MTLPGVDWDLVRSRVRLSQRALDEALTESPERIDAAWRRRAVRLAEKKADQTSQATRTAVLVFLLGQERYAIRIEEIAEVLIPERCTRVPGSSPLFAGVISVRGELRAVLDLSRLLALPQASGGGDGFVLLLRRRGQEIGLKVDRVEDVREVRMEEVSVPSGKYVSGVAPGTLLLLSVDAVLAEIFSHEGVR